MERYDLEVLKGDGQIAARSVALADARAVWLQISDFARNFGKQGDRIRVINAAGEVTISIGVAAARMMAEKFTAER